jgi:hypothetical protein
MKEAARFKENPFKPPEFCGFVSGVPLVNYEAWLKQAAVQESAVMKRYILVTP